LSFSPPSRLCVQGPSVMVALHKSFFLQRYTTSCASADFAGGWFFRVFIFTCIANFGCKKTFLDLFLFFFFHVQPSQQRSPTIPPSLSLVIPRSVRRCFAMSFLLNRAYARCFSPSRQPTIFVHPSCSTRSFVFPPLVCLHFRLSRRYVFPSL